jgi:hypothetical protein
VFQASDMSDNPIDQSHSSYPTLSAHSPVSDSSSSNYTFLNTVPSFKELVDLEPDHERREYPSNMYENKKRKYNELEFVFLGGHGHGSKHRALNAPKGSTCFECYDRKARVRSPTDFILHKATNSDHAAVRQGSRWVLRELQETPVSELQSTGAFQSTISGW